MRISIVIASLNAEQTILPCLQSFHNQIDPIQDEILIMDASYDETQDLIRKEFPTISMQCLPTGTLIPELWSAGLRSAGGDLVALTTGHCVPAPDWLQSALAHIESSSAVGGAIQSSKRAGMVDRAIYFCRYWRYCLPFTKQETADLPGDNVVYKKQDLSRYEDAYREAFWEPFIHARMKKDGLKLTLTPDMVVIHVHSFTFFSFIRNRLIHGYHFGMDRSTSFGITKSLSYFLASPLIPWIHFWRIVTKLRKKRVSSVSLFTSAPVLIVFLIAWAVGEAVAYLRRAFSKPFRGSR